MMKILAFALIMVLSGCGGGGSGGGTGEPPNSLVGAGSPPPVAPPTASASAGTKPVGDCTMDYWGDSIAGITGPLLDPRLQASAPHFVIGGTAQAALPQFLQATFPQSFVAIEYGTNEANGETPLEPALRSMLDRVKALGKIPVLTGLSRASAGDASYHAAYTTLIASLANEYGAVYADWPSVAYAVGDLQADGVHPGPAYAQRLADALSAAVLRSCPGK